MQPEADLKHLPGVYRRPVEPHPEPELLRMLGEIVRLEGVEPDHHPLRPAYRVPAYIVLYILMTALINSREG